MSDLLSASELWAIRERARTENQTPRLAIEALLAHIEAQTAIVEVARAYMLALRRLDAHMADCPDCGDAVPCVRGVEIIADIEDARITFETIDNA